MNAHTVIKQSQHTKDGPVDQTIEIRTHGSRDAVAQTHKKLVDHIRESDSVSREVSPVKVTHDREPEELEE